MPPIKRFLILTSDTGFGHRSAANSIAKALELQHPDQVATFIVNPLVEPAAPAFLQKAERDYDRTVKNFPSWYRFTYEISDSRPASALVANTVSVALYKEMRQLIREMRLDGIVNTNQMFNAPTGMVLSSMKNRPPFFTVVTDLEDVHAMWFDPSPDRYFVASEWVRAKALQCGIAPQDIVISGIPVDPDFGRNAESKADLRRQCGPDPHGPTLLFVGSRRVTGIFEHLKALDAVSYPFQAIVIAGGDNRLYDRVRRRNWGFPIEVRNFEADIAQWMGRADILVTKAGGLILSEGLAAGLPVVLIDSLPGQEEGNVRYILDHQAGTLVDTPDEFTGLMNRWLKDPQTYLQSIATNARRIGRPDAAIVIADALWQASDMNLPRRKQRMGIWSQLE